jgi:hypothetical protein
MYYSKQNSEMKKSVDKLVRNCFRQLSTGNSSYTFLYKLYNRVHLQAKGIYERSISHSIFLWSVIPVKALLSRQGQKLTGITATFCFCTTFVFDNMGKIN